MKNENEIVIKQHWAATFWYKIGAAVGWVIWFVIMWDIVDRAVDGYWIPSSLQNWAGWTGFFSVTMVGLVIVHHSIVYSITSENIQFKKGFFGFESVSIPYSKIRMVTYSQTLTGRCLGYGEVGIDSAGSGGADIKLEYVADPERIKNLIEGRLS